MAKPPLPKGGQRGTYSFCCKLGPQPPLAGKLQLHWCRKIVLRSRLFFPEAFGDPQIEEQFNRCFQTPSSKCNRPSREHTVAMPLFILTETSAGYVRPSQLRGSSIASARSSLLAVQAPRRPN